MIDCHIIYTYCVVFIYVPMYVCLCASLYIYIGLWPDSSVGILLLGLGFWFNS